MKIAIQTLIGTILFALWVWAIVYVVLNPKERMICPPDNYCSRQSPGY